MSSQSTIRYLTGLLPLLIIAAALLSLPICAALLRWYRNSLRAGMNRLAGAQTSQPPPLPQLFPPPLGRLDIVEITDAASPLARSATRRLHARAALYTLAGLCFAAVMASAYILSERPSVFGPVAVAPFWGVFAWPVVLVLMLLYPPAAKFRVMAVLAYVLAAVLLAHVPSYEAGGNANQVLGFALMVNAPFTILAAVFLHRRVRAVGTMVFTLVLVWLSGSALAVEVVAASQRIMYALATAGAKLGLGAASMLALIVLFGALVFSLLGWWALRLISSLYTRGQISDLSVLVDSIWLLYGVATSMVLVFDSPFLLLSFVPAFAVYKIVLKSGRLFGTRMNSPDSPPRLVQLRVFSLGDASARLFEAFSRYWREIGSIRLIAGPDLAGSTVEPHEFLGFLSRKFSGMFVNDAAILDADLSQTGETPDADGRFRVHEFFCRADTWTNVLHRLISHGDTVLMDLRQFAAHHAGCVRELHELVYNVPLERAVFVVDDLADRAALAAVLEDAWTQCPAGSPNRSKSSCRVNIYRLSSVDTHGLRRLLNAVCAAAESPLHQPLAAPRPSMTV